MSDELPDESLQPTKNNRRQRVVVSNTAVFRSLPLFVREQG